MSTNFMLKFMKENDLELEEDFRLPFVLDEAGRPIYFKFVESGEIEGLIELKSDNIVYTDLFKLSDITSELLSGKHTVLKD